MSDSGADVRCPGCDRLLARREPDGVAYEIRRRGRLVARFEAGEIGCEECGSSVRISAPAARVVVGAITIGRGFRRRSAR